VCGIAGKGQFYAASPPFDAVKAKFRWARAARPVNVEEAKPQLG
jgi:hypothetical protein